MLFRNMLLKYYTEAGGSGDAGGSPAATGAPAADDPAQGSAPAKEAGSSVLTTTGAENSAAATDFPEDWRDRFAGEDAKYRKQLERFASPGDLAKSYRDLHQKVSSGELRNNKLPENPNEEELAAWRKDNNVPETAADYLKDLPSGIVLGEADKERVNSFLESMHGLNVSKGHVQAAIEWNQQQNELEMEARHERNVSAQQSTEDALRQEWGGEYRRNINLINGMLSGLPNDAKDLFLSAQTADGVSIFNNPGVAKFLAGLARQINPAGTVVHGATNVSAIDDELATIEKTMRENRTAYNKDQKMQSRYLELLEAKERFSA